MFKLEIAKDKKRKPKFLDKYYITHTPFISQFATFSNMKFLKSFLYFSSTLFFSFYTIYILHVNVANSLDIRVHIFIK